MSRTGCDFGARFDPGARSLSSRGPISKLHLLRSFQGLLHASTSTSIKTSTTTSTATSTTATTTTGNACMCHKRGTRALKQATVNGCCLVSHICTQNKRPEPWGCAKKAHQLDTCGPEPQVHVHQTFCLCPIQVEKPRATSRERVVLGGWHLLSDKSTATEQPATSSP